MVQAHYITINLSEMVEGYPKECFAEELDVIEAEVRGPAESFGNSLSSGVDAEADPCAGAGDDKRTLLDTLLIVH